MNYQNKGGMKKQPAQILDPITIEEQAKLSIEQWKTKNGYDLTSTTGITISSISIAKAKTKQRVDDDDATGSRLARKPWNE
jgi:hypothetical protein